MRVRNLPIVFICSGALLCAADTPPPADANNIAQGDDLPAIKPYNEKTFTTADGNKDDRIDRIEFDVAVATAQAAQDAHHARQKRITPAPSVQTPPTKEQVDAAFKAGDVSKDNMLDKPEFQKAVYALSRIRHVKPGDAPAPAAP